MNRTLIKAIQVAQEQNETIVLATVVNVSGSTPRHAGARMVIGAAHIAGTIGGGAIEHRVIDDARALLDQDDQETKLVDVHLVRELGMCCGGRMHVFLEKIMPEPILWIFGYGAVGQQVARLANRAGFDVRLVVCGHSQLSIDVDSSITVMEVDTPLQLAASGEIGGHGYAVVMSRDHELDFDIVESLLSQQPKYLGMIGSHGKWSRFKQRMMTTGFDESQLDSIQCPVGLDIAALTPEEIALSVVGQMVEARRGGAQWS